MGVYSFSSMLRGMSMKGFEMLREGRCRQCEQRQKKQEDWFLPGGTETAIRLRFPSIAQ